MKICLGFHTSRIFNLGWTSKPLKFFEDYGEVTAMVTGTWSIRHLVLISLHFEQSLNSL